MLNRSIFQQPSKVLGQYHGSPSSSARGKKWFWYPVPTLSNQERELHKEAVLSAGQAAGFQVWLTKWQSYWLQGPLVTASTTKHAKRKKTAEEEKEENKAARKKRQESCKTYVGRRERRAECKNRQEVDGIAYNGVHRCRHWLEYLGSGAGFLDLATLHWKSCKPLRLEGPPHQGGLPDRVGGGWGVGG